MKVMQRNKKYAVALALLFVASVAAWSVVAPAAVNAQGDTPTEVHGELEGPLPASSEGDANWTVSVREFTGEFPEGMTFAISAESDAAEIVGARVVWTHAPGTNTQRSRGAEFDSDTGRWVLNWEPTSDRVPPWVLVRYHWQLTDAQGNRYFTEEIDEIYADGDKADQWRHLETKDVVVHWIGLSDNFGELAVQAMAERSAFYEQGWGGLLPYRPRVVLFGWDALDDYEEVLGRQAVVNGTLTAGTTRADWGGTVQISQGGFDASRNAYGTVLHEIAHLYQEQFTNLTVDWFVESNAEFFAMDWDEDHYMDYARRRLMSGDPVSFAAGFPIRGTNFRDGYWMGTTVWDYFVKMYGLDAHRELWELISSNVARIDAIEQVTGRTIDEFEQDWRSWLGIDAPPPTLIPEPTPMFDIFSLPTPTYGS